MGLTVERTIVIGIFVVIVAILGIAISGAMDPDGSPFGVRDSGDATAKTAADSTSPVIIDTSNDKRAEALLRQQQQEKRRKDAIARMTRTNGPVIEKDPSVVPPIDKDPGESILLRKDVPPKGKGNGKDKPAPIDDPDAPKPAGPGKGAGPGMIEYLVEPGDSLWKIARKHYGDGDIKRIVDIILAANPTIDGDHIEAGETLLQLPVELPKNVQTPPVLKKVVDDKTPKSATKKKPLNSTTKVPKYEVQGGDSLRLIAKRELGDEGRWGEIYELNRAYIEAPEKIHPGMTLLMPSP